MRCGRARSCVFSSSASLHIPIQEGDDLASGAGVVGAEGAGPGALSHVLLHGPGHGLREVGPVGHVLEAAVGVGVGVGAEEGRGPAPSFQWA